MSSNAGFAAIAAHLIAPEQHRLIQQMKEYLKRQGGMDQDHLTA